VSLSNRLFLGCKRLSCPKSWWHHTRAPLRWKAIQRIVHHDGQLILKPALDVEKLYLFR